MHILNLVIRPFLKVENIEFNLRDELVEMPVDLETKRYLKL